MFLDIKPNTNCQEFYLCANYGTTDATIYYFKCSNNLIFDKNTQGCNYASAAKCDDSNIPAVQPSSTAKSTTAKTSKPASSTAATAETTKIIQPDTTKEDTGTEQEGNDDDLCSNGTF